MCPNHHPAMQLQVQGLQQHYSALCHCHDLHPGTDEKDEARETESAVCVSGGQTQVLSDPKVCVLCYDSKCLTMRYWGQGSGRPTTGQVSLPMLYDLIRQLPAPDSPPATRPSLYPECLPFPLLQSLSIYCLQTLAQECLL